MGLLPIDPGKIPLKPELDQHVVGPSAEISQDIVSRLHWTGHRGGHMVRRADAPHMRRWDQTKSMLQRIFTWWNGATIGAFFDIGRRGALVGEDEQGNRYYEERRPSLEGRKRRYVIYSGLAEASKVPPNWHGWMHYTIDDPPTTAPLKRQKWEKEHQPNLTGTVRAYRPKGSLARGGVRAAAASDYQAWTPDEGAKS